jgi:hypothetical protein
MIELFFEKSSITNSEVIQLFIVKLYLTLYYLMLELLLIGRSSKRELYYYSTEQVIIIHSSID